MLQMKHLCAALALSFSSALVVAQAAVEVTNAVVRPLIPGQTNTAVYLELSNQTRRDQTLVAVTTSAASVAEVHQTMQHHDMMKMEKMDGLEIPQGEIVRLMPGGLHIMLMGVDAEELNDGEIDLTLTFESGLETRVTATFEAY